MAKDLLFEIGAEEIPASYIRPALDQMESLAKAFFNESRLAFESLSVQGTPRRLVLLVKSLEERQEDREIEKAGPSKKIAFDENGKPTKVAEGFARGAGISVKDLQIRQSPKGEHIFARVFEAGQLAPALLEVWLPKLIQQLSFPKSMRWGRGEGLRFARPINWIAATFGSRVLKFDLGHLSSGNSSRGHRFLASAEFKFKDAADWAKKIKTAHVVVAMEDRTAQINEGLAKAVAGVGKLVEDEALVVINANLVEKPSVLMGSFDKAYLGLPEEVVIKVLREHQLNFAVKDKKGKLAPHFLVVTNGTKKNLKGVQKGNESVVRARLEDAKFFFEEDQKVKFAEKLDRLRNVTWQEGLGSMFDKARRMEALAAWLAQHLAPGQVDEVKRTALLAKVDLVTLMVGEKEFTSLQGTMGAIYAKRSGESQGVALGIQEHYRPRFAGDKPPQSASGLCAALADKLDTLVGLFGIGMIPTGSQDPYALRRQAAGVVSILAAQNEDLSLSEMIGQALRLFGDKLKQSPAEISARLSDFFRQRLEVALKDQGHGPDIVSAVLARRSDLVKEAMERAAALSRMQRRDDFELVTQAFGRVTNILSKLEKPGPVETALLGAGAEQNLHERFLALRPVVERHCRDREFEKAFEQLSELRGPVDAYFADVMVMADDPALRQNRLSTLHQVAETIHLVADFSKLVKKG